MDFVTLGLFIVAVIVLTITPGPDFFLIMGPGISHGRKAALFTALGFFLAGFVQVPLLAVGLAAFVARNPALFDVLRYGGGAYLMWRGFMLIRHSGREPEVSAAYVSPTMAIKDGFVASLVNPKSHIFLLAFLPQFVRPGDGPVVLQFIYLGVVMRIVALLVEGGIGYFAGSVGNWLRRSERLRVWLERISGSLLVAVGLRLILMTRPRAV